MTRAAKFSSTDERWMSEAIKVGALGLGHTAPNPAVGCVLVRRGRELCRGWHRRAGQPHAEAAALAAGTTVRGATAYVTLEPCSHFGRTPPCANALIDAGVARVVVGCTDPNPLVRGRGLRRLRRAGIRVETGCLKGACAELVRGYAHRTRTNRPWVHLKLAASLDGRIATSTGSSQWISSARSRRIVHGFRARSEGILVGIGTVLADNPRLTARVRGAANPLRIVLDRSLRTPPDSHVVAGPGSSLIVGTPTAPRTRELRLQRAGAQVLRMDVSGARGWGRLLEDLARRDIDELLIEGGAGVAASAVQAAAVDRLTVFYNPRLIGGDGVPMLESFGIVDPSDGPRLQTVSVTDSDGDVVWSGDFL
ncbi:MAG: diaminohydroxyphosphoribosylaminopyrimidine deaminase [Hyphomicrobiaceae bacterium]